jgi:hypothetical protein
MATYVQVHVSVIGLDSAKQFVIVSDIHQDLCISTNSIVQYTERAWF